MAPLYEYESPDGCDSVEFSADGIIVRWMTWSELLNAWIDVDIDKIRLEWPNKYSDIENKMVDMAYEILLDKSY